MAKVKALKKNYKKGEYLDRDIIDITNRAFFNKIKSFKPGVFLGTGKYLQKVLKEKDLTSDEVIKICKMCYYPDIDLALEILELRPDYSYHINFVERDLSLSVEDQHHDIVKKLKAKKKLADLMDVKND